MDDLRQPTRLPMHLLLALSAVLCAPPAAADPVAVRFTEGVTHGFLALHTPERGFVASGDLLQVVQPGGAVESRMRFRFKDGSVLDETVVFSQERVFTLLSYRLLQQGPVFGEDTEISMERKTGTYRVKTSARDGGKEAVLDGTLTLPPDTYNGMVLNVAKNLRKGATETIHIVAFTPTARLVQLEVSPVGEHQVLVGDLAKSATHYIFKPRPGAWLTALSTLLGRMPPDSHAWIVTDEVPAFVRYVGPLHSMGPVWHLELTSPRWPE
jgi:hypothetical protein